MSASQASISLRASSLRSSGVTSATLPSQTSGRRMVAGPGSANLVGGPSGECLRTASAILAHSGTAVSEPRVTEDLPWRPPSAILTIRPASRLVSTLLILVPSMYTVWITASDP